MVEGTKPFNRKSAAPASSTKAQENEPQSAQQAAPDATNLDRRSWFSALVPAAGEGLVKILRASNNLQRELHEAMKAKADDIIGPEKDSEQDTK